MSDLSEDLKFALTTGFIDQNVDSIVDLQPDFIVNDHKTGQKVQAHLSSRLEACDEFWFSVAFLTKSGTISLHEAFKIFSNRAKGKGQIIVSDYLCFTQPEALRHINRFKKIDTRLLKGKNYHGKAYMFRIGEQYDLIVGSSNLTADALCKNDELNFYVSATSESKVIRRFKKLFSSSFNQSKEITNELIEEYEKNYKRRRETVAAELTSSQEVTAFIPNILQKKALLDLEKLRKSNNDRALVVSATGTGKTVLAGLDAQAFGASRLLFVVHRRNIAKKAMQTFKQIFGRSRTMGLYSGRHREQDKDFLFSTVQTINSEHHLKNFLPEQFDYIIIDETHRAGAITYQRVIDYFKPKFLLGMTATPERLDSYDIFSLFNHNLGCEIRLHQALEEELLCPFHYFGVSDLSINGVEIDDKSEFSFLIAEERVERIIEKINEYGCDDGNVRGLVFCSRVEEAQSLSCEFNRRGFRTEALSGTDTQAKRESAIKKIESDDSAKKLDYIFTVDIFNEGIDIPRLNQVILLRPTQSAVIFVQQLGRGLRKNKNKDYLTVLDFIGNYQNNYMIPVALYGDRTLAKDTLRNLIISGSAFIPGACTINFDQITKEKIFESINNANLNLQKDLIHDFKLMEYRLGRKPMMMDFFNARAIDPYRFVEYSKSFYNFSLLACTFPVEALNFDDYKHLLAYLSKEINNGVRAIESLILEAIINFGVVSKEELKEYHAQIFEVGIDDETINAAIRCVNLQFHTERKNKQIYPIGELHGYSIARINNGDVCLGNTLRNAIAQPTFREYLMDSVEYSKSKYLEKVSNSIDVDGFIRYEKYTRKDVFRILNWKQNPVAQNVGGYKVSDDKRNCAIFVTYKKDEEISATTKYEDKFLSRTRFSWMSKNRRKLNSRDVDAIITHQDKGMRLPLFIKKSDDEGQSHYFIGNLSYIAGSAKQTTMPKEDGKYVSVVNIQFEIDQPVEENLYKYLTSS